jgi:hypothetical protein
MTAQAQIIRPDLDEIRARLHAADVLRDYGVEVKEPPRGDWFGHECPRTYHRKSERALVINPESGLWQCYAGCAGRHGKPLGGDLFTFIAEREGLSLTGEDFATRTALNPVSSRCGTTSRRTPWRSTSGAACRAIVGRSDALQCLQAAEMATKTLTALEVPDLERLVTRRRDHMPPVWGHRARSHPVGVAFERGHRAPAPRASASGSRLGDPRLICATSESTIASGSSQFAQPGG